MRSLRLLAFSLVALAACSSTPTSPRHDATASALLPPPPVGTGLEELPPDPREPALAEGIDYLLSEQHLSHKAFDDALSREAFAVYLERLDGGKLFLLKQHIEKLEPFADQMDDQLRGGDLKLARAAAALLAQRRAVVADLVASLLAAPLDFSDREEVETDPEKLAWAESDEALRDRWRRILELQVLEKVAQLEESAEALAQKPDGPDAGAPPPMGTIDPGEPPPPPRPSEPIPPTFEGREAKARADVATSYAARFARMAKPDPLEPADRFLNAVCSVFDPHTAYMPPAEEANFDIDISGKVEGIGAALGEEDHYIAVREVIPGGGAWQQGELEVGDLILAVAQQGKPRVDVTDMPINKVVGMIRGPKDTVVTLTVKKPDGAIKVISIKRDVVKVEAAYARGAVLERAGQKPVGYVYLPGFYGELRKKKNAPPVRNATDDVRALLEEFERQKLPGVVIDLRGNGGGILEHATGITGLFIDTGPVVQTRTFDGTIEILADDERGVAFTGEVVVLVDKFSASASEILAAALQDHGRALVVGTGPTHGKGTVQTVYQLDRLRTNPNGPPLGVFKLTVQQYYRVNGDSTQWRGVTPDVVLPDPAGYIESGERFLEHTIPWNQLPAARHAPASHAWDVAGLVAASARRQAAEPAFAKVKGYSDLLAAQRDASLYPLEREAWFALRKHNADELKAARPKLDGGPPRLTVALVGGESAAPRPSPGGGEKPGASRLDRWREQVGRDPWLEEAVILLSDMGTKP